MNNSDQSTQWKNMDDETRAVAYSPSSALDGPLGPFIQVYSEESRLAYSACPEFQTISYGDRPANTFDFVAPSSAVPVPCHVFIHGGYWQELSKKDSFFPAPDTLANNVAFAAIDYTLCPDTNIEGIVEECCSAIMKLVAEARNLNIDTENIIISGSSAGAHLAAMVCLKLPKPFRPSKAVLLSGVYELEPLIGTYINDALSLDQTTARQLSPALQDLSEFPPALIGWGQHETDEFKRQSLQFANLLKAANQHIEAVEIPNRNHFDIVHDIANNSELGQKFVALAHA